jgi:uncharacterized protein (DUF4415 family)
MTATVTERARRIVAEQSQSLVDAIATELGFVQLAATPHTRNIANGPTDEECAVAAMMVSNPQSALRKDGDGWQKRVNDVIRGLRDERNALRAALTPAPSPAGEEGNGR